MSINYQIKGYLPEKFGKRTVDINTGKENIYLPAIVKIEWFRLAFPNGLITHKIRTMNATCAVVEAFVYTDCSNTETSLIATGAAAKFVKQGEYGDTYLQSATTTAIAKALTNAGFIINGESSDEGVPAEVGYPIVGTNSTMPLIGDVIEDETINFTEIQEIPTQELATQNIAVQQAITIKAEPIQNEQTATLEDALNTVVTSGVFTGKTMLEIKNSPTGKELIQRIATTQSPESANAKIILEYCYGIKG